MGAWRLAVVVVVTFLTGCGGGAREGAAEPDCPSTTGPRPTATTTVDPRCVERATETSGEDEATDQVWKGTVHQVWNAVSCKSEATSPAEFTISGPDGRFQMTISFTEVASDCPVSTAQLWGSGPLTGQLTEDRLSVEGGPLLTGSVSRSGDRINGSYTNPLPTDARQTYVTTWDLKCERGCTG